jgi:hypothetical protein
MRALEDPVYKEMGVEKDAARRPHCYIILHMPSALCLLPFLLPSSFSVALCLPYYFIASVLGWHDQKVEWEYRDSANRLA